MNASALVQKLWNYCNVVCDDGMSCAYDELVARDKASLDIFWLKDEALADSDNLPASEVIAQEIVDDLEAAPWKLRESR